MNILQFAANILKIKNKQRGVFMKKYLGWGFTIIALIGTFLNAQMNVLGFFAWIISNIGFMILNLIDRSYPQATLFFINTLFSMCGIYTWQQK